jgi:hypothetical protein
MNSDQVTRRQARTIKARLQITVDYVTRLAARMRSTGFGPDDELMTLVGNAERALYELQNDLLIRTQEGPTAMPQAKPTPEVPNVKSPRTVEMRERIRRDRELRG